MTYRLRLINILSSLGHAELALDVVSQYSFIIIDINKSGDPFGQLRFEITDESGKVVSVYCEDRVLQSELNDKIQIENWPGWTSPTPIDVSYSHQVLEALETADSISTLTVNCARGDNYRPGNFSKISVTSDRIKLEQINHMNAKSLSHKHDYCLRNLVFTIPLQSNLNKHERDVGKYQVGIMMIEFWDRSSENNRACGEKVTAALEKLIAD